MLTKIALPLYSIPTYSEPAFQIPGSGGTPPETITLDKWEPHLFHRLRQPNRLIGNDGATMMPSSPLPPTMPDQWLPKFPDRISPARRASDFTALFSPPRDDTSASLVSLDWLPVHPNKIDRCVLPSADHPSLFQPDVESLPDFIFDWIPNAPSFLLKPPRSPEWPQVQALYPGTRLYLPASVMTVAISPTPDSDWEDTTSFVRTRTSTVKSGDALTSVVIINADSTSQDVLFRQYISQQLVPGQIISGSQAIKAQLRINEADAANNMYLTIGIRVMAADGTTVRKTVLAVTRDDVEAVAVPTGITNRRFTATSAAGDYTTVAGDRLCIEIGMGGDPTDPAVHTSRINFGDSASDDLPEDDSDTSASSPWLQFADQFVFAGDDPLFIGRLPEVAQPRWANSRRWLNEYPAVFAPPFQDSVRFCWLPTYPNYIDQLARTAYFQDFFQPPVDDVSAVTLEWLPIYPDKIDRLRLPPAAIPAAFMCPRDDSLYVTLDRWQNYLPVYLRRHRQAMNLAWLQPAMMAQLFTGSDFLHAEWACSPTLLAQFATRSAIGNVDWESSPSIASRFGVRPSLQADFDATLSLGANQGTNP